MVDVTAEHYRLEDDGTLTFVADLPDSINRTWLDRLNEAGTGRLTLFNDDAALAAIERGDLIRFLLDGTVAFAIVAEEIDSTEVSDNEEVSYVTVISGRWSLLEQSLVYPAGGVGRIPIERDRLFGWPSFGYDDSDWDPAVPITTSGGSFLGAVAFAYPTKPVASGWPADSYTVAEGIWGVAQDIPDTVDTQKGTVYFRKTATIATAGDYMLVVVLDDFGIVYVDGLEVLKMPPGPGNFTEANTRRVTLSAGDHVIAVEASNAFFPGLAGGLTQDVGLFALALHELGDDGNPGPFVAGFETDDTWLCLAYPAEVPGVSPGAAVLTCLEEAQDRGAAPGITADFDADLDSDGVAWPILADLSTKTGTDLLTFLRELSATYVDFYLHPETLVLSMWRKDGRGTASGVEFDLPDPDDPSTGSITGLSRKTV